MRDRWDEEDELEPGGRTRGREREPEMTVAEAIDGAVRKLVTGLVIAGGLIALGVYSSGGGDPSVDYQIATTTDGKVYRLNSENGRIVACQAQHCWLLPTDRDDLEDGPPAQNAAAAAPPQAVTTQPAPAQLPAPQNSAAPAAR